MLFVDFSSAFNRILAMNLIGKLHNLGLNTTLFNLDIGLPRKKTPESLDVKATPPQDRSPPRVIVKYADDATIIGSIINTQNLTELILGENKKSCRVVHREQSAAQRQMI